MKAGEEKDRLQAALSALGTEDDGNNVTVEFGAVRNGAAQTDVFDGGWMGRLGDDVNQRGFWVTIDPARSGAGPNMAVDAAHEGTHVADLSDPRMTQPTTALTLFQQEYRAYHTSAWAARELGFGSLTYGNGRYQIWNSSWGAVDAQVLTNFLTGTPAQGGRGLTARSPNPLW